MIRINIPYDNSTNHGHVHGSPPHAMFIDPCGEPHPQGPCCGMGGPGGRPFSRSAYPHPHGPPHHGHLPHLTPPGWHQNHTFQQRVDTGNVDRKLASVEHKLHQTEQVLSQLTAQRTMLLSKQQELKQEKRRQHIKEQRQMFEEKSRHIAAWKQHQAKAAAAEEEETRSSQPIRLIRGMDGRLYQVVATTDEEPSDDASKNEKVDDAQDQCASKNDSMPPIDVFEVMQAAFLEAVKDLEEKELTKKNQRTQVSTAKASTPEDVNGHSDSERADHKKTDDSKSEKVEDTQLCGSNVEDVDVALKWILHGIGEGCRESSNNTTADATQVGAESKVSPKEAEKNNVNVKEEEKVDKPVEMKKAEKFENDGGVQVEDVPEVEWEEVGSKTSTRSTNDSASSSLSPKMNEGESWMEPVNDDKAKESNANAPGRSSRSFELV